MTPFPDIVFYSEGIAHAHAYGPAGVDQSLAATTPTTVLLATLRESSPGWSLSSGALLVPRSGLYWATAWAFAIKSTTGSSKLDVLLQTDVSGSYADVAGTTVPAAINGQSKGGGATIAAPVRLIAGSHARLRVEALDAMDIPIGAASLALFWLDQ